MTLIIASVTLLAAVFSTAYPVPHSLRFGGALHNGNANWGPRFDQFDMARAGAAIGRGFLPFQPFGYDGSNHFRGPFFGHPDGFAPIRFRGGFDPGYFLPPGVPPAAFRRPPVNGGGQFSNTLRNGYPKGIFGGRGGAAGLHYPYSESFPNNGFLHSNIAANGGGSSDFHAVGDPMALNDPLYNAGIPQPASDGVLVASPAQSTPVFAPAQSGTVNGGAGTNGSSAGVTSPESLTSSDGQGSSADGAAAAASASSSSASGSSTSVSAASTSSSSGSSAATSSTSTSSSSGSSSSSSVSASASTANGSSSTSVSTATSSDGSEVVSVSSSSSSSSSTGEDGNSSSAAASAAVSTT